MGKVVDQKELLAIRKRIREEGKKVVFTNGCFDILHRGHVEYLEKAKAKGDVLIVGINSDESVGRLKGPGRPVVTAEDRAHVLAALAAVDYVTIFQEDTPYELIRALVPDALVKGADWSLDKVVGRDIVEAAGGSVQTIEYLPNRSTSGLLERIKALPSRRP
jgi:D-beta-D-heptose 7-phosphate kinase/D-beta-D-heptose 1-phosphate adenosyltransferase